MSSISVIVPTLNRLALLMEAVESAIRQTRQPLEVVVVDDGSDPPVDSDVLLTRFGSIVRIVRNVRSEGLAWARHQGVEAARGEYVLHLDDDDLLSEGLVEECAAELDADPTIELVFVGVHGFGRSAAHFNQVQPTGTARVVEQGGRVERRDGLCVFGQDLFCGLLNQVPMPFQRVMARREVWHKVSRLRLAAYQTAFGLDNPEAARDRIRGTLRDSEWALYAALACRKTALVDHPLYLQRCDGQGGSSRPAMRQKHIRQSIEIKSVLTKASSHLLEARSFRQQIAENLARSHFDAAYEFIDLRQYAEALRHLSKNLRHAPSLKAAKLLLKLAAAWVFRKPVT